jgi:integrase
MKRHEVQQVGSKVRIFLRNGSRCYHAAWCQNAKEKVQSLRVRNLKEAQKKALVLDEQLARGCPEIQSKPSTLESAAEEYLRFLASENRAPSTLKRYKPELARWVEFCRSECSAIRVDQISKRHLDLYRAKRKEEGIAESTRYHESILIVQFGNYLERAGLVERNPFSAHRLKRPRPNEQPCYTAAQLEAVLLAAKEPERAMFAVLAFSGMRVGELRHLTWDNIDSERGFIHVVPKEGWETKNHRPRLIPMHERVKKVLSGLPRRHTWVFTARPSTKHPDGDGQVSDRRLLSKLKRILERLNIDGCVHSFRHFFASHCANRGVPPMQLLSWLGHSSMKMLERYYHQDQLEAIRAMENLNIEERRSLKQA